jgi:hypothetical protein
MVYRPEDDYAVTVSHLAQRHEHFLADEFRVLHEMTAGELERLELRAESLAEQARRIKNLKRHRMADLL